MCYKERFNEAYFSGSNVFNLNMETDMPGSRAHREYRQREDMCSETSSNPLGAELGTPPACFLSLEKSLYKPEVFAMLKAGLPQAAQDAADTPAGNHLSSSINYLLYLIKMGEGFLKAADQVSNFINKEQDLQLQENNTRREEEEKSRTL